MEKSVVQALIKMKKLFFFCISLLFACNILFAENVVIKFKVENEIITNIDIKKEQKYLLALNNNLKQLPKKELEKLAERSLLNEKIKLNTLKFFFDFSEPDKITDQLFSNMYLRLGFESEQNYKDYLNNYNLNIKYVKNKIKIEGVWNKLIYQKFKNQVQIDKTKIKKQLNDLNTKNKNNLEEYSISEILFKVNSDENLEQKHNLILSDIKKIGFESAANIYSLSESSKYGGKVGWVKKVQLLEKISALLDTLEVDQISNPLKLTNGYLLLKINEIRKIEKKINFQKEFDKMIILERDRQLNELSLIYFNKIKQRLLISEL